MQGVGAPHCCEHSLPLERSSWEVEHSYTSCVSAWLTLHCVQYKAKGGFIDRSSAYTASTTYI